MKPTDREPLSGHSLPSVLEAVIDGPAEPIHRDLATPVIAARRVVDTHDGDVSLDLEPLGEAAIAARMGLREVTAFSVEGPVQTGVNDHEFRTVGWMSGELHRWHRAASGVGAVGQ